MPIPAGEMRRLADESRQREAAHRRIRRQRRARRLVWWLVAAGVLGALLAGARLVRAAGPSQADLLERIRVLGERIDRLEADRQRPCRAFVSAEVPPGLDFAREPVPLDRWDVRERLEREALLALQDRGQVILWLKRAARYFPFIQDALLETGLPDDLKYVAVIESALLPVALSPANARGIWQLIPSTARRYGLRVTSWWDERRDPEAATRAALAYLADLHGEFGTWPLALAAYNSGEARVKAAVRAQGVRNYYQLALPSETERYVFRAIAAKLILARPRRYGFDIPLEEKYLPASRDRVRVRVRHRLTVRAIAQAAESFYREVKQLNPAIVRDALPAGTYVLNLPAGTGAGFTVAEQSSRSGLEGRRHLVKRGDTLSAIARRYGVSLDDLRRWNPKVRGGIIHPGEVLSVGRE